MNKKAKKILMAGLITLMTGSSMISSNALHKNNITANNKKSYKYIVVNGKRYPINSGVNKPSQDNTNTGNNNNTNNNNNNNNVVEKPNNDNTNGDFASFQKEVVRLVNVERAKVGLKDLSLNSELSKVATLKSQDMINKNYFSHTSPTYGSPFDMMKKFNISYKTAGENIAKGQKTPAEVVNAWMNSKGHRENILNKNYTEIGIGVAKDSKGTLYWTQMFIGR